MVLVSSLFLHPSLGNFKLPEAALFQAGGISHIFGSGFESIEGVLGGGAIAGVLAILLVMKFAGTLFTVGSGSAGGVFAPLLFMGAMLGGLFGLGFHAVAPGLAPILKRTRWRGWQQSSPVRPAPRSPPSSSPSR